MGGAGSHPGLPETGDILSCRFRSQSYLLANSRATGYQILLLERLLVWHMLVLWVLHLRFHALQMLCFVSDMFSCSLQLWNTIRIKWNHTPLQLHHRGDFDLFWLISSNFWRPCAPLKTCWNQRSHWDPSNQPQNTTEMGWICFIC